jgi:hypothetical protein
MSSTSSAFARAQKRISAAAAATAAVAGLLASGATAAEWPSKVQAAYQISFNGFSIGTFQFAARTSRNGYVLDGDAEISALLGVINWRGLTRSSGKLTSQAPDPRGYIFSFKSNNKGGTVKIGFGESGVTSVSAVPTLPVKPGEIPLKRPHLQGDVLDPLSAVMALTRTGASNPCGRTLKVFDGKQRFNLGLTYRGKEAISSAAVPGAASYAYVCGVRYNPIAGYKPSAEVERLRSSGALEVALRPVPSANLFIPHEIRISTIAGPVRLTAQRVDITMKNQRRIALMGSAW